MLRHTIAVFSVSILILIGLCGCSSTSATKVPYVPPEYYNCTEVTPQVLCDAYYSRYANVNMAEAQFNGLVFVFKNIQVTALMFKHLDEGYFFADNLVQCYCLSAKDLKRYKTGDKIDVVGIDEGVDPGVVGLVFKDCIIMPAGSFQLPAPGSGVFVPTY